jgi:hypothetical protein
MNTSYAKSSLRRMTVVPLAAIALIFLMSSSLRAQRTLPENVPRVRDPESQVRSQEIETTREKRDPQLIMAEVNEDFGRLRILDEEIKSALKSMATIDYKHIADSSVEIRKRATRLKANIIFPAPPKDEKRPKAEEPGDEFGPLLAAMDRRLTSFLTNPIFSDTGSVDVQLANRAKYDLEDIIKLTDKLRKSATKMEKNAARS